MTRVVISKAIITPAYVVQLVLNILKPYLENLINLTHFIGWHKIYMGIREKQDLTQKCEAGLPTLEWIPQRESQRSTNISTRKEMALFFF